MEKKIPVGKNECIDLFAHLTRLSFRNICPVYHTGFTAFTGGHRIHKRGQGNTRQKSYIWQPWPEIISDNFCKSSAGNFKDFGQEKIILYNNIRRCKNVFGYCL